MEMHFVHQSVCCGIAKLFAIIVAMDTKFGRIYCAISHHKTEFYNFAPKMFMKFLV